MSFFDGFYVKKFKNNEIYKRIMYTIDTSIYRLLGDKLITTFTYNKLWALSLFTVGDLQAMGIKKLWAIPGIGLKVINDVEHVFATINSQDPLLEIKQFCGDEIMQKMVICYAHLCENAGDSKEFQAIFPSSLDILKFICMKGSHLMSMVDNYPRAASCLYVFLLCLEYLMHDIHNEFSFYVHDNAKHYMHKVGKDALGTLLYSRLSNKNRFLLELHYAVFKKNFKVIDDVQIFPFVEDRLTYEVDMFQSWTYHSFDKIDRFGIEYKLKHFLNDHYPFSLLDFLVEAYTSIDFEHTCLCTIGLFPFMTDKKVSFVIDFHQANGYYPMFTLFTDYLDSGMFNERRCFFLEYRGIGTERRTLQELMKAYNIKSYKLKKYLSFPIGENTEPITQNEHWKYYDFLYEMPFIGFYSPICKNILEKEHLQDVIGLMELIFLRNSCYPLNKQFRKYNYQDRFILVNACLFDTKEIAKLVEKMKELLATTRFKDEHYQASMFLKELDIQKLGGKEHFISFFTYLMVDIFGLEVDSEGGFVAERNKISVTYELLDILKERGKPMRAEEIRDIFLRRCPTYRHLTVNTIRVYLLKMKEVKSIGLSGYYGLASWEHIYWGTMVDKIYEVLSLAGKPLSLMEIYQQVKAFFPNSTKSSIEASMRLDARHRFKYDVEGHVYFLVDHST